MVWCFWTQGTLAPLSEILGFRPNIKPKHFDALMASSLQYRVLGRTRFRLSGLGVKGLVV